MVFIYSVSNLRIMKKKLKFYSGKLVLFSLGLLLSLLAVEILLGLKIIVLREFDNDGWWKWRWHTLKRLSKDSVTEFQDQFDPVLGWVPKNNFQTKDEFGTLTFNSFGIRSKKEYSTVKSKKKRIVVVGDSFTYGECVGDNETYSAYLEQLLSGTEVLNFGVHGYGLDPILQEYFCPLGNIINRNLI